jgi:poly(A) polymerase
MSHQRAREAAETIVKTLRGAGHVAYLAGGCVRDLLLGREPVDYDVVTDARPERVSSLFKRTEQVGAKFGVVLVRLRGVQTEVATFRAEGAYSDGRHPDAVRFGDPVEDAGRRDFTVNGMFYDLVDGTVIDHVGGRGDLEARVIRAIGDPDRRFTEDHLRMLRAVRFAARLGFTIEPGTFAAIRRQAHRLPIISPERIREELRLILCDRSRVAGWEMLVSSGLSEHLIPNVGWSSAERGAVSRRLASLPDEAGFTTTLAALLSSRVPGEAEEACRRLRCSNHECHAVGWLLTHLPRVRVSERLKLADVKLFLADDRFDDLMVLLRADLTAAGEPLTAYEDLETRRQSIPADEVAPPPFVTGDDLLARNVPQGPAYSRILDAVYRAQLSGEVTTRYEALEMAAQLIDRNS